MNMSTFRTIKYMYGSVFFFERQVYKWVRSRNTGSHTRATTTPKLFPRGGLQNGLNDHKENKIKTITMNQICCFRDLNCSVFPRVLYYTIVYDDSLP